MERRAKAATETSVYLVVVAAILVVVNVIAQTFTGRNSHYAPQNVTLSYVVTNDSAANPPE